MLVPKDCEVLWYRTEPEETKLFTAVSIYFRQRKIDISGESIQNLKGTLTPKQSRITNGAMKAFEAFGYDVDNWGTLGDCRSKDLKFLNWELS